MERLGTGFLAVLDWMNGILWEWPCMLVCFLAAGLYFSVRTGWFQFRHFSFWLHNTWGSLFSDKSRETKDGRTGISEWQSVCTALAATVGTGNIAGVATAIVAGGPGAVFWMWVSASLGMMTSFAEKTLGTRYRKREAHGSYSGGPMEYMEQGLHARGLALLYGILCMIASFGIGNVTQVQSMAASLQEAFSVSPWLTGAVTAGVAALILLGGIHRIGSVAEKLVPGMAILYLGAAGIVLFARIRWIPKALLWIVEAAFGGEGRTLRAASGGLMGYGIRTAMRIGVARGVFTNEAGLGTSVFAHSASSETDPARQGMWGIFEVFADTMMCIITALVILTGDLAGADLSGLDGAALTMKSFSQVIPLGNQLIAVCMTLFAFASLIGWSYYGERCMAYLCGKEGVGWYRALYILVICLGAAAPLTLVWKLADVCNGLMAIPNLLALYGLRKEVIQSYQDLNQKRIRKNRSR
jgi:AGCS family alanine or glycine:cation symporter